MSPIGTTEMKKKLIGKIHLLREIPGFSAYELAVKHGFEGTEEEWLASLKGEKGDIGTLESHSDIDAQGNRVVNVTDPEADTDGVNKRYVDAAITNVEEIAISDFIESEGNLTWLGNIYKQGKVIFVHLLGTGETSRELFTIKKEYGEDFISANGILVTTLSAEGEVIPFTVMGTGAPNTEVTVIHLGGSNADAATLKGLFYLNFTYICK